MAGHSLTPYAVTATRKFLRDPAKKQKRLLLASIGPDETIDVLDAVVDNVLDVEPYVSHDGARTVRCVVAQRQADSLAMVFAADISGEVETVHDGTQNARPIVFTKLGTDVARLMSVCILWRPADETDGVLLVHSPWGRGGSRATVVQLLQRAVDEAGAKAKLHADPMIPGKELQRFLRQAKATKIVYSRTTGIRSTFDGGQRSAQAEMDLIVKGTGSIPYRDALAAALQHQAGGHGRTALGRRAAGDRSTRS